MKKRILSLFLVLVMMLSLVPTVALADAPSDDQNPTVNLTVGTSEQLIGSGRLLGSGHAWSSGNTSIVTVSGNNNGTATLTGVSAGETTVTHTWKTWTWQGYHWVKTTHSETWTVIVSGSSAVTQNVYVYLHIVDDNGNKISKYDGMTINEHGWFTVGKIQVDLPAPDHEKTQKDHLKDEGVWDKVQEALQRIEPYTPNAGLDISSITGTDDQSSWERLYCRCAGADNYVSSDSYTWHLDGHIKQSELEKLKVTVTYTDGVENEVVFPDQRYKVVNGTQTPGFVGTPARTGYVFTGWSPEVAETVSGETTYTATWIKESVTINYVAQPGGSVSLESETLTYNAEKKSYGTPDGSTAEPESGYTFDGWYDAETNGNKVSSQPAFKPETITDATYYARFANTPTPPTSKNISSFTKELVAEDTDVPADISHDDLTFPVNGKVTIPADGSVTLLYKLTVTGDEGASYTITDQGATVVSGSLTGMLGAPATGETASTAVVYVTKTFDADDIVEGKLTNTATIAAGDNNTTVPQTPAVVKTPAEKETAVPEEPTESVQWDISKSKKATNLNSKYESTVTLSLPSAEKPLVTDVVFVLDKSTSTDVRNAAVKMLSDLNEQVKATSAKVKVGVVIFNMEDHRVLELTELNDYNFETIQSKIQSNEGISGGTNTHAGLLAGKAMLDDDDEVDYSRKYLIFVSDGITYIFDDDEGVATSIFTENFYHETGEIKSSLDMSMEGAMFKYLYGTNIFASTTIPEYLGQVKSWMDADGKAYWVPYGSPAADANAKLASHTNANGAKNVTDEEYAERVNGNDAWDHANNLDTALYLTDKVYQEAVAAGYHCYAMKSKDTDNTNYPWASIFMEYLAGGKTVDFSAIQNDILYLLGPGSTIVDEIGHTSDYNFDLVVSEGKCPFTLTVGGVAYKAEPDGDNAWVFYAPADDSGVSDDAVAEPKPDFRIEYNNTDTAKETITWTINTNVSNFAPVQLTYTVKLTNPKTAPDTYGKYDADGSEGYAGLYTNNSATLYPVDSEGNGNYVPEKFNKPTVSYTVEKPSTPSGGSSSGGGSPVLNTDDHYSYIIGYKDGYLRPYGTITRGEVATIFFRLLTDEARDKYWSQTNDYSDCNSDLWCNNAISTLSNMGIIDGYTDGTFRPYGKITRAQFAKIAVGFFETTKKEYQGYYSDVPENAWFTDYVEAASRVGLIQGFEDGTFRPNTNITRAQACVIVNRALNRKPDEDHLLPEKQMVTWPDNNPGDWYYADMQEATNSHDYTWLSKGSEKKYMEDWTKKLEQRDWAAFEHAWSTAHSAPGGEVVK